MKTLGWESSLGLEVISAGAFWACVSDAGRPLGAEVMDRTCSLTPGSADGKGLMERHTVLD